MAENRYVLSNGIEIGDKIDAVNYLQDPENQELRMQIKAKIELFRKGN